MTEPVPLRVLGLGNDLLGDDAFGLEVARQVRRRVPEVEVVESSEAGFALLDHVLGARCLVVVDTLQSGTAPPGTLRLLGAEQLPGGPAVSPHGAGLPELLALARALDLAAPSEMTFVVVEPADCATLGAPMHPAVRAAIPLAVEAIAALAAGALTRPSFERPERSPR